jgi:pimeloyl-ACP methyl ester carboxylesterase
MDGEVPRAEPIYFGSTERPRFGWLHRVPPGVRMRAEGMIVCNPFGSEVLSAHRSLRHFAEAAAALGVATLRFDYDGTGDSAGTDRDPRRLAAWLRSVHDAIDELRRLTGVERVHLLGLRLGAALAALAAVDREDVAGLVAIVPTVSGVQWLREVDALQIAMRSGVAPRGVEVEAGVHESVGFVITPETRASLSGIDLLALPKKPAAELLLISRADLAPNQRLADRMGALGSNVDHRVLAGYTEMMLDAHETIVPAEMIRAVCGWLDARASRLGPDQLTTVPASLAGKPVSVAPGVEETATFLDQSRRLFGIVSAPASGVRPTRAVVILNSGSNHRIGPGRLYVQCARRWAARGYLVMRVDLSGIGDSAPWPGEAENLPYPRWAMRDVEDSVAYLRDRWGVTSCCAIGLCSGGYHGLRAAVSGVALNRVVLVNPLVYFWKPGMLLSLPVNQVFQSTAQYRRSLFQASKWKKLFAGKVDLAEFAHVVTRRIASDVGGLVRDIARIVGRPLADDLGAELEGLSRRNVSVAFVFAAGNPGEELLRVQAGSSLRKLVRDDRVRVHLIHGPNHTFTPVWSHALLIETLDGELGVR